MDKKPVPISFSLGSIAGELAPRSRRVYLTDARLFAEWLQEMRLTPGTMTRTDVTAYRAYLLEQYAPATARRMFSVARRLLLEQVRNGNLETNPAEGVRGIKAKDESPHIALTIEQANQLLTAVDRTTRKGSRDYAMIALLLYTGIRRFECAALTIGSMGVEQGHHILTIEQGKGRKRATIKLRTEAWRAICEYLVMSDRTALPETAPLFCQFRKGDTPVECPISSNVVYRTVIAYALKAGIDRLKPHGMRASFITLALEGGAKLEQVQYAARHEDPRTTERYQRRKLNLDNNAVDYIHL